MSKTSKPARRFRRHDDAPANWQWRPRADGSGRPRWIPSPTLRKAGWTARDLKGPDGAFLSEGLSRDAARAINAAVAAWRRGEPVAADYATMAPAGAAEDGPAALPQAVDRLAIGRLIDAFLDSREFKGSPTATGSSSPKGDSPQGMSGGLRPSTQAGYRKSLKRLIDTLAGFVVLPARDDPAAIARYAHAVATVRAARVTIFQPSETASGIANVLYTAYWALFEQAGKHQAYAVIAATSAWLAWARRHQSSTIQNWAADIKRTTPPGRIRPLTWPEVKALVDAADAMGVPSIGDAVILGVDLSWSQADRLALIWPRLKNGRAFTRSSLSEGDGPLGRQKTGRVGGTPLTGLGRARVARILARHRAMPARPTHVLWCELTNRPWEGDHYRKTYAKVRARAALAVPSVLTATDADLRDTAFTWMKNAGLSDDGIASRTLQSRKHIAELGDAAYGEIGPEISDPAARMLDAYLTRIGAAL